MLLVCAVSPIAAGRRCCRRGRGFEPPPSGGFGRVHDYKRRGALWPCLIDQVETRPTHQGNGIRKQRSSTVVFIHRYGDERERTSAKNSEQGRARADRPTDKRSNGAPSTWRQEHTLHNLH